ncbi:MAG: transglutaminase family protein [Acidobacteria bacterium]|nr:transglutaminase family protein [Acidobacteriota bacterium]MBI3427264.1 transglutaminase family protein [Acidobacteriota bacterium]
MFYSIRHVTRFVYSSPITESITEVRMQPRSEVGQRCLKFDLNTQPRARLQAYGDFLGNVVHHFDIPGKHKELKITAETTVEMTPAAALPDAVGQDVWEALQQARKRDELWDYLAPSPFVAETPLLLELAHDWQLDQDADPLSLLRRINTAIYEHFDYVPNATSVDSPIDLALDERRGVCQDFAHIMLSLLRWRGIPARYVSGYLYHGDYQDRSEANATHAWVEAWLPELGWIGFDPTNNLLVGDRHIRTAVGRDYSDVPPTRGVFKGNASSELSVGVQVALAEAPLLETKLMPVATWSAPAQMDDDYAQQQQQQ